MKMLIRLILVVSLFSNACNKGVEPEENYHNKILFTSSRNGIEQLYMMNPDGTAIVQVTRGQYSHDAGRWSPNAKQIVSRTNQNLTTACTQMVVLSVDGTNRRLIGCGLHFAWSPNGAKIVFSDMPRAELGDFTTYIYVVNPDGSAPIQLTNNAGVMDDTPSWSPDGMTVAFSSDRDYPTGPLRSEIYLMNTDGSNQRPLTFTDSLINGAPAWSPDGNAIAFVSNGGIAIIDKDGKNFRRITEQYKLGIGGYGQPSWSPDGHQLAIISYPADGSARSYIYTTNAEGTQLQKILDDPNAHSPHWSK